MKLERTDLELEVIVRRIEEGEVDLQPDFQRGEVWNAARQRRLLDTVLRHWYVPPIHLIRDVDVGADLVLDGQQRLAAILAFFRDELAVAGDLSPRDESLEKHDGLYYSQLPDDVQRSARRFPLSVVTLTDYEPEEPYELFFRLNQHMTLTPPEKRNALYGPARDQIKQTVEYLTANELLSRETVGFANRRLAYDDVFARFCLAVHFGTLRRQYSNAVIEEFYRKEQFGDDTMMRVGDAATSFLSCATQLNLKLNKATLFSWLIFTYAVERRQQTLELDFVQYFEDLRAAPRSGDRNISMILRAVMAVYNDRASYRVNDTLSILLRDLSLHLVRSIANGESIDRQVDELSDHIKAILDSVPVDIVMTDFLENGKWDLPGG